ncbi:SigmaW regulon antibacterial [Stieleria maiorica]|uniref:SigmaW regulon antibacterial n=1 Tax=Stieleria maiorica TaxID=2795974 RepID=A0A5B9M9Z9_9BACT|nr:flotillin-like FloA family protein [Stieleria maiorica]QEF96384.1 SigmaW regulon antibacterial [Stieleria maiorica]
MNTQALVLLCGILLILVFFITIAITLLAMFRPWLQCFLSGTPVPLFKIVGMRLRNAPVRRICEQRIKAGSVGVDLPVEQLEDAHRKGADIEKLTDSLCLARRSDRDVTWDELLHTELVA